MEIFIGLKKVKYALFFYFSVYRDSLLVPIINCGTSFYAGFVIFSVLGFMAKNKHTSVANVVDDGMYLLCNSTFVLHLPFKRHSLPLHSRQRILNYFFLLLFSQKIRLDKLCE